VKLLLDENLSPRLAAVLADVYPGPSHVHQYGLGSADDTAIWEYAKNNGFVIVSKDSDFEERSLLLGCPPKVVWLRVSNCTSADVEGVLRTAFSLIVRFVNDADETCLVLSHRGKNN
jgi:predicted nuclease of predicted toxin-antitoxin system